jgi:hypothetical protein
VPDVLLMLMMQRGVAVPLASCSAFAASLNKGDSALTSLKGAAGGSAGKGAPQRQQMKSRQGQQQQGLLLNKTCSTVATG